MADLSRRLASQLAAQGEQALRSGEVVQAELLFIKALEVMPSHRESLLALAGLASDRADIERALAFLRRAQVDAPADLELALRHAHGLGMAGDLSTAQQVLESALKAGARSDPHLPLAWLALAQSRQSLGDTDGSARAFNQALQQARRRGQWVDDASTPPQLRAFVLQAREAAAHVRKRIVRASYEAVRREHGDAALQRVDRGVADLLGDIVALPAGTAQRPKSLYIPDLPEEPYLEPSLQPWAAALTDAYPAIRREAMALLASGERLPSFMPSGDLSHLSGPAGQLAWDAFFFYRHGQRYDNNLARCPATSAALESVELFRIEGEAPEICFSVLAPHTTIKPHFGVSNARVVMHLPLIVPEGCALNLLAVGEHRWQEGRLVMFDDTYEHEAWNRSEHPRVVLLMDCWNPHLTAVEKQAIKHVLEAVRSFEQAL
ncbi:MAG TPA: aspartyl/asparaginyl beta-hydroxylase domain-containing protein [Methylibium sp.]|uniref:aspartyl/asparaginyl beta-hydroxylase domain-containing protein n=1 Tax=Methylibium sp. TaxID=2067992 RepID=UPI002DBFC366|nr:aspartyl/asparaginyl beta-hydroxylase domain-containing protein [Methylibium sp.]HEU4459721.1 aspartyl/asparaginyl beta-hydroxylase domain-containing protein [Methylibium sp.]